MGKSARDKKKKSQKQVCYVQRFLKLLTHILSRIKGTMLTNENSPLTNQRSAILVGVSWRARIMLSGLNPIEVLGGNQHLLHFAPVHWGLYLPATEHLSRTAACKQLMTSHQDAGAHPFLCRYLFISSCFSTSHKYLRLIQKWLYHFFF